MKAKGVDVVAVISYNDAFVMNAWSKANGIKNDEILFLEDPEAKFSKSIGWTMGPRTARYAIVIDKGTVIYAGKDEKGQLDVNFMARRDEEKLLTGIDRFPLRRLCWPSCKAEVLETQSHKEISIEFPPASILRNDKKVQDTSIQISPIYR